MATRTKRAPMVGVALLLAGLLLALLLIFTGAVGGSGQGPSLAAAQCGGIRAKVEPVSRFPAPFASQYQKKLRVTVYNRTRNVKTWHLELYTYSGFLLGKSKERKWLTYGTKAAIKLRQSMQPGPYTVVVKGDVVGCGESQDSDTVKLRNCLGKLPIRFFNKPKGLAADYNRGGYVSVGIEPREGWSPVRGIRSTLVDFDGVTYGRAQLPKGSRKLIGQQYLNHKLKRKLHKGGYSVFVRGRAPEPKSCGNKTKTAVLKFK